MENLEKLRTKIDKIDQKIGDLLQKRFQAVEKIKDYKAKFKLSVTDKARETEILHKFSDSKEKEVFQTILKVSRKMQRRLEK